MSIKLLHLEYWWIEQKRSDVVPQCKRDNIIGFLWAGCSLRPALLVMGSFTFVVRVCIAEGSYVLAIADIGHVQHAAALVNCGATIIPYSSN